MQNIFDVLEIQENFNCEGGGVNVKQSHSPHEGLRYREEEEKKLTKFF